MKRSAQQITISIASIAVIAVSVFFIVRSTPRTAPAVTTANDLSESLMTVDQKDSLSREEVASDPGLQDMFLEILSSQDGLVDLSPAQLESLAQRSAAIVQVRAGSTFEDYIELMESWGGTCKLGEEDLAMARQGWKLADDPVSIKRYGVRSLQATARPTGANVGLKGSPGLSKLTTISQFQFKTNQYDLLDGKSTLVELTIPTVSNAGDVIEQQFNLIWSPEDNGWIPSHLTLSTEQRRPLPASIF